MICHTLHDDRPHSSIRVLMAAMAAGFAVLAAPHALAAPPITCSISAPTSNYLYTDVYETYDRQSVCYDAGVMVFGRGTVTIVGRARCTDDSPGSHPNDYEIPGTVVFDKNKCAASVTFQEGGTAVEARLFFDKAGTRFRGSFKDDKGVGNLIGERQ